MAAGEKADRRLVLIESDGKPYKFNDITICDVADPISE